MTVLTYNPIKQARIIYLDVHQGKTAVKKISKRHFAIKPISTMLLIFTIIFSLLYFREIFFYSNANEKIVRLRENNQNIAHENQLFKNQLSRLESLESLRSQAEKIGLTKPTAIVYPQETYYSLR